MRVPNLELSVVVERAEREKGERTRDEGKGKKQAA